MIQIRCAADLMLAMLMPTPNICIRGYVGLLQGVEREDGSGKNFNVSLLLAGTSKKLTVFVSFNKEIR